MFPIRKRDVVLMAMSAIGTFAVMMAAMVSLWDYSVKSQAKRCPLPPVCPALPPAPEHSLELYVATSTAGPSGTLMRTPMSELDRVVGHTFCGTPRGGLQLIVRGKKNWWVFCTSVIDLQGTPPTAPQGQPPQFRHDPANPPAGI